MPKTLLTRFWLAGDVMIASSLTRWQSFQLKWCSGGTVRVLMAALAKVWRNEKKFSHCVIPSYVRAPRSCSLIVLLVHPTVCRSTLVTFKYSEWHWSLRKQANSFRQNKSIKTPAHSAATQLGDGMYFLANPYLYNKKKLSRFSQPPVKTQPERHSWPWLSLTGQAGYVWQDMSWWAVR